MADLLEVIKGLQTRIENLERTALVGSPSNQIAVATTSTSYTYRQATAPLGLNMSTDVGSVWLNTSTGALQWWDGATWWTGEYPYNNYSDIRVLGPGITSRAEARGHIVLWSLATAPGPGGYYDIWYDTSAGEYKQWRGSSWFTITDTKLISSLNQLSFPSRIYVNASAPGGASIGYYWLDSDDDYRLYRWNGIAWETVNTTPNFIVPISDGIAPSYSPTPAITGLVKSLIVMWQKVPNVDNVTYEVHISAINNFTPSVNTFSQQTQGTMALISTLADGSPLVENTTYYVKLVAKDNDGAASASNQSSGQLGLVGSNQVESISADKITAGNLLAVIALIGTLNVGNNITISPDQGILITLTSGGIIQFPANGSEAIIQAKLRTSDLVVNGGMMINGATNNLAGTVYLLKGVNAPATGATATNIAGKGITLSGAETPTSNNNLDLVDSVDATSWLMVGKTSPSSTSIRLRKYNKTTGALTNGAAVDLTSSAQALTGLTRLGSTVYVLHANVQNFMGIFISKFSESTLTYSSSVAIDKDAVGTKLTIGSGTSIGTDGTNICVFWNDSSGNFRLYKYDATTLAFISVTTITGLNSTYSAPTGMTFGNADIGSGTGRFWVNMSVGGVRKVVAFNSNAYDSANTFNATSTSGSSGIFYDGTRFYTQTLDTNRQINQYSNIKTDTNTFIGWTLYDATGTTHETTISTVITNLTVNKRSWLYLTVPVTFLGTAEMPDSVRFYCGTVNTANANLWLQASPGLGITSAYYETLTLAGSNPPVINNFIGLPGNTPGDIRSEATDGTNAYIQLKGTGESRLGQIYSDTNGNTNVCTYGVVQGLGTGTNNVPTTATQQGTALSITTTRANQVIQLEGAIDVEKPNGTNGVFTLSLVFNADEGGAVATSWACPTSGFRTTLYAARYITVAAPGTYTAYLAVATSKATTYNVRPANGWIGYRIVR